MSTSSYRIPKNTWLSGYKNILSKKVINEWKQNFKGKYFFNKQDNAPCHTPKVIKEHFEILKIETIYLPPDYPDLKTMYNFWEIFSSRVCYKSRRFQNNQSLWKTIKME